MILIFFSARMGNKNGKHVLTEEDFDYIANHTAISRPEVEKVKLLKR